MYLPCNHEVAMNHELAKVVSELVVSRAEEAIRDAEFKYRQKIDDINEQYKREVEAAMKRRQDLTP